MFMQMGNLVLTAEELTPDSIHNLALANHWRY
jgi:hypothetical protein